MSARRGSEDGYDRGLIPLPSLEVIEKLGVPIRNLTRAETGVEETYAGSSFTDVVATPSSLDLEKKI